MTTPATPHTATTSIEPPWAGIERSVENIALYLAITFILIPIPLSAIFCGLWWLVSGGFGNPIVFYGLSILLGSVPFLKKMDELGRLIITVKSQQVMIVTNDLPSSASREASDSREETPLHGFKLGEGTHVLSPFDQEFVTMKIEIEYQVSIDSFRVTIGGNHMLDLQVKSAVADFKTDSEHLLALARIDTDEGERKKKIETRMKAYIKRFIEEECRSAAKAPDGSSIDPAEKSSEISVKVEDRIKALLENQFPGFQLKSFTLGDIDKPQTVEEARDKAATVEQMTQAASNMLSLNNAPGAPADSHMTPQEALDSSLIAAGIKTATKSEKGLRIDPETIAAIGSVAIALVTAVKSGQQPIQTTNTTSTT